MLCEIAAAFVEQQAAKRKTELLGMAPSGCCESLGWAAPLALVSGAATGCPNNF